MALLATLMLACGRECHGPFARCDGNVASNCGWLWLNVVWGRWDLSETDCADRYCEEPPPDHLGFAFCAPTRPIRTARPSCATWSRRPAAWTASW
jgi:hypothetical protein